MMKIFKYLDGGEMLGGELELIKKAPPGIKKVLYNYHDKVYNDFYAKNPNRVVLRNKAKAYGQAAPTPLNIIKQIYNYIGSDPTYGLRAKIALDNRAFDRLPTKGKINVFWDALLPSRPFYNIYKSTQRFLDGGLFKESLEPPTYGVMGELGRNIEQGALLFKSMMGSLPMQLVTAGLGAGIGGMVGPTVRIVRDVKNALGSAQGFRLATRKFSRNINARKGNPEFRWTKTSGDIRKGGVFDRLYQEMGPSTRRIVNNASHSEGSGYSALPTLDRSSSAYQWARKNPESVAGRRHTHAVAENNAYTSSNRVFRRNLLIDRARDWRNYIFE